MTSPGTNELSAEQPFRPRRPNAYPLPAGQAPDDAPEDGDPAQAPVEGFLDGVLRVGDGPAGDEVPPRRGVLARLRHRVDDLPMVLAVATLLALVAAVIWVGTSVLSRDETRRGDAAGRLPIAPPSAQDPGSPVASAPPSTVAPTAAVPTVQPVAPQPSRPRSTPPPPSRAVRATVSVVNDRGGAFQLGVVVTNTAATAQSWELVITFPVPVTNLRAVGDGELTVRPNQAVVRGRSGPGDTALAIGGVTSDGSALRTWTCTVNGQPC